MPDWLRWPRLWYATPTFVLFIALQAPDWRFTGRLCVALLIWAMAGVGIDVWMARHQQQPGYATTRQDIRRLINWTGILGFVVGFPAGLYAHAFRPTADRAGAVAAVLNTALDGLGIVLPALDVFHQRLLEMGRFGYAAYLGSFFVLVVVAWLPSFFLFYRALADMPSAEFAKVAEEARGLGKPPYRATHRLGAWLRLMLVATLVVAGLLLLGRVLPMDAADPAQSDTTFGRAYVMLGVAGTAINIFIFLSHNYRRFLATLQPDGFLPAGERGHE